ncbi:MAG TPA: carbon-nitrogen hydrolase family protein [Fimbriimonadaceae bacterium]|jgi:predicted amidohydrolase
MHLACVQTDVVFGDPLANAANAIKHLEKLRKQGADLVVFPEAYLTGYCVDCAADAHGIAIPRDHEAITQIAEAANRLNLLTVFGFAEESNGNVYNAAALTEPGRETRFYQKTHLPILGLDRFVQLGNEIPVFETRLGKIGILICYDLRPPEAMRVLALAGVELVVLPTNWPEGAEVSAEHISIARAAENGVFVATCDRTGHEHGFNFIGLSKIISPKGKVLAGAGREEAVLTADINLAEARDKHNINIPDKYETQLFESRRPELYGGIEASLVTKR